tara:strand:+ start:98 stop:946 length:849 start_codon:yes stop_codon:yes gene_type:complete
MSQSRLSRIKLVYEKGGFKGLINHILSKLKIDLKLNDDISKTKRFFSNFVANEYDYKIQSGHFKGIYLKNNLNIEILSNKLENLYETEVINEIIELQSKYKKKYFVNLGASDGFYVNGFLAKNIFDRSICFDIDKKSIIACGKNLNCNKISTDRYSLINKKMDDSSFQYFDNNNIDLKECLFLIDIEGNEIDFLSIKNIEKLKNSILIIEMHEFIKSKDFSILKNNLENSFQVKQIGIEQRNLEFREIHKRLLKSEIDKNIYISELRPSLMKWYVCVPKSKF